MRITAIIVAAGRGERLGGPLPKQFQPVLGQPLLYHTLRRFVEAGAMDDIVLVLPKASDLEDHLGGAAAWPLPVQAVAGGAHRQDSVAAGLKCTEGSDLVLVHDGARPLVPDKLIRDVIDAASRVGAALPVVPCVATVKEVDHDHVLRTLDRSRLVLAQTPQAFRRSLLVRAHALGASQGLHLTDDAALVERLGVEVAVVAGAPGNIKVTSASDLGRLEHLLQLEGFPCDQEGS